MNTILLLFVIIVGETLANYCQIHPHHTLCVNTPGFASRSCGQVVERGVNEQEKALILQLHNELRNKIATGNERRGSPGPQPPAANMMELTWDNELALTAQVWTERCIIDHDCPRCRRLSRFPAGQNLYAYGAASGFGSGSWQRSILGWYDEVIDFNPAHNSPFFSDKRVLIGHFTQLVWGTTSKIGCGKLIYYPNGVRRFNRGRQTFVCNYGRAGNYVGATMYEVGTPCSLCPPGTACSPSYPGLCTGNPTGPLITRHPITTIHTNSLPTIDHSIVHSVPKPDRCIHTCDVSGSCSVRIFPSEFINGHVLGSCFPKRFGGNCRGIPNHCSKCLDVCPGHAGQELIVSLQGGSIQRKPIRTNVTPKKACQYDCQSNGGCSVRMRSNSLISGKVLGSCFSPAFGGRCTGIPKGCRVCSNKCRNRGGEKFIETIQP